MKLVFEHFSGNAFGEIISLNANLNPTSFYFLAGSSFVSFPIKTQAKFFIEAQFFEFSSQIFKFVQSSYSKILQASVFFFCSSRFFSSSLAFFLSKWLIF